MSVYLSVNKQSVKIFDLGTISLSLMFSWYFDWMAFLLNDFRDTLCHFSEEKVFKIVENEKGKK